MLEQEFGFARLAAGVDRLRDRTLEFVVDAMADLVTDWSGGHLRDDVSLVAIERLA